MGEDQSQTGRRRLTVAEASEIPGVTVEAVRGRIKRGTLEHERTGKGVFVLLPADQSTDRPRPDTDQLQSDNAALISAKDETIAALREQLEAERQAHSGARRLLMAALERIPPQLEAPQEASDASETVEEEPERAEPAEYWRGSGGRTEALVAQGVWLLAVGVGDFIGIVSVLLGLLIVLVLWIAPFVGLGLAAYQVFRGRVSRWTLRALVVGIPLAVALGLALILGAIVLYLNAISE